LNRKQGLKLWNTHDSAELYKIRYWGKDYYSISEEGEVLVKLFNDKVPKWVSLPEILMEIKERGYSLPVLLRFPDILGNRIEKINNTFLKAIKEANYKGDYKGVYPIKVNQQQQVIEEIMQCGNFFSYGLEAGSKAELLIAISAMASLAATDNTEYSYINNSLIICNGYKDDEFIDLALFGMTLGIKVILVAERLHEVSMIIKRARTLDIKPCLGLRIKLSSTTEGKWAESAGDLSPFGLSAPQSIDALELLKQADFLDTLKLLHYHMGSQIPDIRHIRSAIHEASRYYVELVKEGASLEYLDIGGGLAVDYDGSKTNFEASKNYSLEEYCADIIEVIQTIMDESEIPHPVIISEAGRAIVAYYSVLLFNILDINTLGEGDNYPSSLQDMNEMTLNLHEISKNISVKNIQEAYHDALYYRDQIRSLFLHGEVSLRERSLSDKLFWDIIKKIHKYSKKMKYIPEELQEIEKILADIYYGNFSLFQSLPDSWAIKQLFPIMPIHRLNEQPKRKAIISDITCDCDGKIDKFIDLYDVKETLHLHDLKEGEDYIIGVFLIGAYQETLGDLHNLFGDTNVLSVALSKSGNIEFKNEISGDTVENVLSYVEYDTNKMIENVRRMAEKAVHEKLILPKDRKTILDTYIEGLRGYTYFEL
jgi:arginine decarboxylase